MQQQELDAKMAQDTLRGLDAIQMEALQAALSLMKKDPRAIANPELAFFKEYLQGLGPTMWLPGDKMIALQAAVQLLKKEPTIVSRPELSFFRDIIRSWSASALSPAFSPASPPAAEELEHDLMEEEEQGADSEELVDDTERMSEDHEPFPEQPSQVEGELTQEQLNTQNAAKKQAMEAAEEGRLADAVTWYTEAIKTGPSALLYDKRADLLLRLRRPNACIADCSAALQLNPDIGKAYRLRGKAHRRLGHWEEAHKDLSMAQHLDFDDDTVEEHNFVDGIWKNINERLTKKRLREERIAQRQQLDEIKRRKEAALKAHNDSQEGEFVGVPTDFADDPELSAAFQDPRFAAAMRDIINDRSHMTKYQSDPEVMHCVNRLLARMGSGGTAPTDTPPEGWPDAPRPEGWTFEEDEAR